jgi:hypothetical protein
MNGTGFKKNPVPSQSRRIQSNKIPFLFVEQKFPFDEQNGPVVNENQQYISSNLINLIKYHKYC